MSTCMSQYFDPVPSKAPKRTHLDGHKSRGGPLQREQGGDCKGPLGINFDVYAKFLYEWSTIKFYWILTVVSTFSDCHRLRKASGKGSDSKPYVYFGSS